MASGAAQVAALRAKLQAARQQLGAGMIKRFAVALEEEIAAGFSSGVSPFGKRWDPTRAGNSPLIGTGALASSFTVEPVGENGIVVRSTNRLARILQGRIRRGSKRLAARVMLPGTGRIGRRWVRALRLAAEAAIAAASKAAQ